MITPICSALSEHSAKNYIKFHTGSRASMNHEELLPSDFNAWDFTELPGLDDLHSPMGVILESQKLAAKAFGASQTFFSVNGSTAAILALILGSCNAGDVLVMDRGSHVAAFNACEIAQVQVVLVEPIFEKGIPMLAPLECFAEAAAKHSAAGVFITRPNYFGCAPEIEWLADALHEVGRFLIVDEAHGTHFGFHYKLPKSALKLGADGVAQSAHKTLGALNQTAFLHVAGGILSAEKIGKALSKVQTTSPSYPLLASLDYSRAWLESEGHPRYEALTSAIELFWSSINAPFSGLEVSRNQDPTRVVITTGDLNGNQVSAALRDDFGIQVEFSNSNYLVCIAVPGDEHGLIALAQALNECGGIAKRADSTYMNEFPPGVPRVLNNGIII
ncbi:MAG: aminotransferase class I/II-fold pyridoxal phosphate-dependent enzyme [Bacillota bacterium]